MQRILMHVKPERRDKELEKNPVHPLFWKRSFHFETIEQVISLFIPAIVPLLKISGFYQRGLHNALDIRTNAFTVVDPLLPAAFDGFRLLFLSDLHIDGNDQLPATLSKALQAVEADLCILGGDYRFHMHGHFRKVMDCFERIVPHIQTPEGIVGILGNHDSWEMIKPLEQLGVAMLINESLVIERDREQIWVMGLDDPHYYECDDYDKANQGIPAQAFRILAVHATKVLLHLGSRPVNLCLCGHTHAGQIRLPLVGPLITHSHFKGEFVYGRWQYQHVKGYTTSGVGTSGINVRYNTRPELALITLRTSKQ